MALQTKTITGSTSSSNWTWKMDVIENSTNTNNNTSSVTINTYLGRASSSSYFGGNANCKIVCNGETRSINKNFSYPTNVSGGGWVLAQSETFTVGHNADGSKSIGVSSALSTSDFTPNSASASGEMSLTTIPRASSVSGGSGNIGASSKITITRASSNFTHTLTYAFGTLTGTIATGVGTSYDWTIPTTFYAQIPNANSGTGTITCITYSGSTEIGRKSISFTANVTNSNPTTGSFTYKDSSTSMVNITQNDQRIIRNKSYLVFVLGTASAKNSATISKYEVTFNGVTKSSTTATNLDFGTINLSSNATATLKVTDSRGNTATKQITVIIDDWVLPTGLINIQRKNNYYSETYIKVDGTCSSLNGKNSMTIQYKYKKVSDSSYSSLANLTDNVQETLTLDNQYQWNVVVVISDKIGQTTYNLFVDRGTPIIYYDRKKSSVGINTFPTENEALRVAGGNINIENTGTDVGYQQGGNMILRHNLGVTVVSGSGGDVMLRPKGSTDCRRCTGRRYTAKSKTIRNC